MEDIHRHSHAAQTDAENAYTSKRQRRPSVRLGEIGDQPAALATLFHESLRRPQHWKSAVGKNHSGGKSSKIRQLAKLNAGSFHHEETLDVPEEENRESNFDNLAIGAPKKPRTNWIPKIDEAGARNADQDDGDPWKEQSSQLKRSNNSSSRVRVEDEADLDGPLQTSGSDRGVGSLEGVKNWLQGLGLVRYWPVFEIHEVDEEVLPLLTLEDLKDMGVNAVGSRRKMFGAIEKLRKGFS